MLRNLNINNAAVAKNVDVEFESGFTVITGETGSGKSVMVDCLSMIAGSKTTRELVRSGEEKAVVTSIFDGLPPESEIIADAGVYSDENGELMLLRTLSSDGRSTVKANGRSITLTQLRDVSSKLLGINTQDEKNFLTDSSEYTEILDGYAGNEELLKEYREKYDSLISARSELRSLLEDLKEKSMMTDILTYQIKEIDSARLSADDEEEKLERLRVKIKSAERVDKSRKVIYKALNQNDKGYSAAYLLERASAALEQVSDVVEGADDMIRRLDEYRFDIIDIAETVNESLGDGIDGDPAEKLNQVESRLNTIEKLKKKYGSTIPDIKEFRRKAAERLKMFNESDESVSSLKMTVEKREKEAFSAAEKLRKARTESAKILSGEILETLKYLDMPKVRFIIDVLPLTDNGKNTFTPVGCDAVDFRISVNPGEMPQSLSKVASGGEMSRVLLALRSSVNKKSGAETVIFDEIDSGVSGSTSERIGRLLKKISAGTQVICITHSPQIASLADRHLLISKKEVAGRAESFADYLGHDERVCEIAGIIGGINVTEKQREAAREMLAGNFSAEEK